MAESKMFTAYMQQEGRCPFCGEEDDLTSCVVPRMPSGGEYVIKDQQCNCCGAKWREKYRLQFTEKFELIDPDGNAVTPNTAIAYADDSGFERWVVLRGRILPETEKMIRRMVISFVPAKIGLPSPSDDESTNCELTEPFALTKQAPNKDVDISAMEFVGRLIDGYARATEK